jgi:hypothetical protein
VDGVAAAVRMVESLAVPAAKPVTGPLSWFTLP